MNADCWSHITTFLSLTDLKSVRELNKDIKPSTNYIYNEERRKYLHKKVCRDIIRKKALKDWVYRSPLLCCITGDKTLMTSRFGCSDKLWDPPLGWYPSSRIFHTNFLYIDSNRWGTGSYIDPCISGWNRKIWENRVRFMKHNDSISNIVSTARNRIFNKRLNKIKRNFWHCV